MTYQQTEQICIKLAYQVYQANQGIGKVSNYLLDTIYRLFTIEQMESSNKPLTTKQQAFIDNLLAGVGTQTECAIQAGYSTKSAKVEASRLLKQDKVLNQLQKQAIKTLGYRSITALDTVSNLSQNANSEYVRLEASKDILDRAGIRDESNNQIQLGNAIQVNIDLG